MAGRTFLVATAGAVTGALATAFFLTLRAPPPSFTPAPSRFFRPTVVPEPDVLSEIVDPAGIFQYGG